MLNCQMMLRLLIFVPKMLFIHGNTMNFPIWVLSMIIITRSIGTMGNFYANFKTSLTDKIKKLCVAAKSNEKLFRKLLKGQCSTTQMNAFLTDGKLITDKNDIHDMWANHFEDLGKPSVSPSFDHDFFNQVATHVRNIFALCQNELP